MREADAALYRAQSSGRHQIRVGISLWSTIKRSCWPSMGSYPPFNRTIRQRQN